MQSEDTGVVVMRMGDAGGEASAPGAGDAAVRRGEDAAGPAGGRPRHMHHDPP